MDTKPPFPKAVAIFAGAYLLAFGGVAIAKGNGEFIFYLGVMLILVAAAYAVHRRVGFSPLVLWLLALWGFGHMGGGTIPIPESFADGGSGDPVLYSFRLAPWFPRYDQLIHVYGFCCATLASGEGLWAATRPARVGLGFAAAAALMGAGFGAINEVVEFIATRTLPETNVGGYVNTGWDLVSNTVGALLGAVVVWKRGARPSRAGSSPATDPTA